MGYKKDSATPPPTTLESKFQNPAPGKIIKANIATIAVALRAKRN